MSGYHDLVHAQWKAEDRDAYRGRLTADLGNARLLTFDADGTAAAELRRSRKTASLCERQCARGSGIGRHAAP